MKDSNTHKASLTKQPKATKVSPLDGSGTKQNDILKKQGIEQ